MLTNVEFGRSESRCVDDGWRVVFDSERSYLQHKRTSNVILLKRDSGVYIVDAYLEKEPRSMNVQVVGAVGSVDGHVADVGSHSR